MLDTVEYVVQVNGKVRAKMNIEKGLGQEELEKLVLDEPNVQKWLEGKTLVKKIFVPDKLVKSGGEIVVLFDISRYDS